MGIFNFLKLQQWTWKKISVGSLSTYPICNITLQLRNTSRPSILAIPSHLEDGEIVMVGDCDGQRGYRFIVLMFHAKAFSVSLCISLQRGSNVLLCFILLTICGAIWNLWRQICSSLRRCPTVLNMVAGIEMLGNFLQHQQRTSMSGSMLLGTPFRFYHENGIASGYPNSSLVDRNANYSTTTYDNTFDR